MRRVCLFLLLSFVVSQLAVAGHFSWKKNQLFQNGDRVGYVRCEMTEGLRLKQKVEKINENLFRFTNIISATRDIDSATFRFEFVHSSSPRYLLIPSVSYNGNYWGKGEEPKGFVCNGVARSYEYRRTAVPGATYSEGSRYAVAMWGVEQRSLKDPGFSCSLFPGKDEVVHTLIYPDEELPDLYSGKDVYAEGYKNYASYKQGEQCAVTFYLYAAPAEPSHRSVGSFLDNAWRMARKPDYAVPSPEQIWDLGFEYATRSLWAEEDTYKGFHIGLVPAADGGFTPRRAWKYEIGWCGNNGALANALLSDYLKTGRQESLEKALACLDTWSARTSLPNGLFVTHYDNLLENREDALDACNLAAAANHFFMAYELCNRAGSPRPRLRQIAFGICDFILKDQQSSGQYGKAWSYQGECLYRDGTIGAFLISSMVRAYQAGQEVKYLNSARSAFHFYMSQLLQEGYTTAGALDTWCIDCESAWGLLSGCMLLHDATGEDKYLDHAEAISQYIATWQWHYDAPYPANHDFTTYGYHTFGASSVSTQHHHISSHTVCVVADWIELSKRTRNPIWKERALALWNNSAQLISDGNLEIHGRIRPKGSQNEAFFQCNWCFYDDRSRSINEWLVAWPTAFRLDVLRHVGDWNDLK